MQICMNNLISSVCDRVLPKSLSDRPAGRRARWEVCSREHESRRGGWADTTLASDWSLRRSFGAMLSGSPGEEEAGLSVRPEGRRVLVSD